MPTPTAVKAGLPIWVDLSTTDDQAARAFYSGLFDWQWSAADMPPSGTYWTATLRDLPVAGLSKQPQSTWNTYIAVDSADEATNRALAAGAQVLVPPTSIGDTGRMAFLADPSGAAIGLWQPGTHRGAGLVSAPGAMIWHEVYAADTNAVTKFYSALFGWQTGEMPMPGGSAYTTFALGEQPFGGTAQPMSPDVPPHWQVWFGAADTEQTVAKAKDLGATIVVPPTPSPIGTFAFLIDPTGAAFSIITADQS